MKESIFLILEISDAGGGGERVLWTMINTLQGKLATLPITLFTGFQSGINSDNLQELIMVRPHFVQPIYIYRFLLETIWIRRSHPRSSNYPNALPRNTRSKIVKNL